MHTNNQSIDNKIRAPGIFTCSNVKSTCIPCTYRHRVRRHQLACVWFLRSIGTRKKQPQRQKTNERTNKTLIKTIGFAFTDPRIKIRKQSAQNRMKWMQKKTHTPHIQTMSRSIKISEPSNKNGKNGKKCLYTSIYMKHRKRN